MPAALDAGRLYVFVFGPGRGESVAVRVPPDDWLVVDSCRIANRPAAAHVLDRYGGRPAVLLLTHRHQDHYGGFVELLARGPWDRIGCNDWRVADAQPAATADPEDQLGKELAQVLAEIEHQWASRPVSRFVTRRGAVCPIGEGVLHVLHPDEAFARAHRHGRANHLSAAAVLEWRGTTLLLGADVENPHWPGIAAHRPDLGGHAVLKVPHHASREAQDDCFLRGPRGRTWLVTPYSVSRLPRFEDGQGLATLLGHEDVVHLTGLPVRHAEQNDAPCETTRRDLADGTRPRPLAFALPGGIVGEEVPPEPDGVCCYIGVRLDAAGTCDSFYGPGSLRVR